jgi:hypothetical protein
MTTGTTIAPVTIDTSNGIATAWTAYTGYTIASGFSATCKSFNNDYWRVEFTFTGAASGWTFYVAPAGTTNPTQSTGIIDSAAQGSAVFYGAQVELGSFASSYIPTTTASVTRVADVNTVPKTGIYSDVSGSTYCEAKVDSSTLTYARIISGTEYGVMLCVGASITMVTSFDNTTASWASSPSTPLDTAQRKCASAWGNSFQNCALSGTVGADAAYDGSFDISVVAIVSNTPYPYFGNIKNVAIWNKKLPDSALQDITE